MSLNSVKRALSSLPYTEMKALGEQVNEQLGEGLACTTEELCDVLAALPISDDAQLETEAVFLSRAFTKKRGGKSEIQLKPVMAGREVSAWEARSGDFMTTDPSVRHAISNLLDQIAAYEALMK